MKRSFLLGHFGTVFEHFGFGVCVLWWVFLVGAWGFFAIVVVVGVLCLFYFNLRSCSEEGKRRKQCSRGTEGLLQSLAVPQAALSALLWTLKTEAASLWKAREINIHFHYL